MSIILRGAFLYIGFAILGEDIVSVASLSAVGCLLNCALICYVTAACRRVTLEKS